MNNKELKNSTNKFELEGNVGNIGNVFTNANGKKSIRFDLGQNNNDNTQFVPIVLKGNLVDTFGNDIEKGNWITVKGRISTYTKSNENNSYKEKVVEMLGFEIIDRSNNKVYTSDGQVKEMNKNEEMER